MQKFIPAYGVACVVMFAAAFAVPFAAQATTIVLPTDEQLISKSRVIVEGDVLASAPFDRNGSIWTETNIAVLRAIKGEASGTIAVREPGGTLDDRITQIFGGPEFESGSRVLLFLDPQGDGTYRVVDLFVGKFDEATTVEGERLWLRDDVTADVTLLDARFQPIVSRNVQRNANGFEQFVHDRVAGREGVRNYGVENPVLAKSSESPSKVESNFTLISEPSVYRWSRFDNGSSTAWYSAGTQPGYGGGGVSELQTAMNVWTSYGAAKILYSYAGTRTGAMGGLSSANGVNEVLFDDPLNEISGSWNRSTGGVVGTGGFNGVTTGGTWNAPFTFDAAHPAGPVRTYTITEGNLTIQDNVSSANGISSRVLGEIIAHEFGHTLGFGHSPDSSALMYASVTGLGPSLRDDDQLAARWLYPNGNSTPEPVSAPAAPSNLRASSSVNYADLAWTDNASNETSQAIWLAAGSNGAFSKFADVAANATSARLTSLAAGTYRVYIVATNVAGSAQSDPITFSIAASSGTAPVASFTASPSSGVANVTNFSFVDTSTGTIVSRQWNFGDGTAASSANATHVYASAGTFTVTLIVNGTNSQTQTSRDVVVTSASTPVTPTVAAAFDVSATTPAAGALVAFTDRSSGSPTNWSWSFGDGSTSSAQNPTHAYANAGTYTITLTAANASSNSIATKTISVIAAAPYSSLVSVAAQTGGANGTSWRTELSLFNAGAQGASVSLLFLPSNGGSVLSNSLFLSPKQSVTYANALRDVFGIESGAGAVTIQAASAGTVADLRITSRTFTSGSGGTYGQAVPEVGAAALSRTLYITGIEQNASYRTNVGLVNRAEGPVSAAIALIDATGNDVSTRSVTLPGNSFQQQPLSGWFPAVDGETHQHLTMRIIAASDASISGYASVVDNITQDPIYIQAVPAASGGSLMIPVVGRAPGANATFWRSDVTFFNPTDSRLALSLRFNGTSKALAIDAGETHVLADVVADWGQLAGSGALQITWSGGTGPVVTSRTYTSVTGGGTYGQSIDPVSMFAPRSFVPGLRNDASYRSNVGFVNGGSESETFTVKLLSQSGNELARTTLTLAAKTQAQYAVTSLFPNVNANPFTLQIEGEGNASLFAYGSMVDNVSGDPVFFSGR
ncbi:MAG TPA: PKD domain-containing protein [Thermoanaerobaculia bacterium]|nr:PKD domain-containing protein [Thermoanaerobaculia bacterium]